MREVVWLLVLGALILVVVYLLVQANVFGGY